MNPTVIESNNISAFDVDRTLLMYVSERVPGEGKIEFTYGGRTIYLTPNQTHIDFLRHCNERGDYIIVWSANGYNWAKKAVAALGLEPYVNLIMSKVARHVDDKKEAHDIIGNRVYISDK